MALVGIVNVPVVVDIVKPLIVVAVAAPNVGVVNEGDTRFANVPVTVGKVKETSDVLLPTNDILPEVVSVVLSPIVNVAPVDG